MPRIPWLSMLVLVIAALTIIGLAYPSVPVTIAETRYETWTLTTTSQSLFTVTSTSAYTFPRITTYQSASYVGGYYCPPDYPPWGCDYYGSYYYYTVYSTYSVTQQSTYAFGKTQTYVNSQTGTLTSTTSRTDTIPHYIAYGLSESMFGGLSAIVMILLLVMAIFQSTWRKKVGLVQLGALTERTHSVIYCTNCGTNLVSDSLFCRKCGSAVTS